MLLRAHLDCGKSIKFIMSKHTTNAHNRYNVKSYETFRQYTKGNSNKQSVGCLLLYMFITLYIQTLRHMSEIHRIIPVFLARSIQRIVSQSASHWAGRLSSLTAVQYCLLTTFVVFCTIHKYCDCITSAMFPTTITQIVWRN